MISNNEVEPYVGLRPYDVEDTDLFFGRQREIWELSALLLSSRLVVVYGPAGAGKTSLLQAGIVARLGRDLPHVLPVARLPRASATRAGQSRDNPFVQALLAAWTPDAARRAPSRLTLSQHLQSVPVALDRYEERPLPMLVVIDQFEQLFSDDGPVASAHRNEFLLQLAQAIDDIDHLNVAVCLRQEAIGELLPYESLLSPTDRRRYRVEALERKPAIEAVVGPLRHTTRSFAPGVAEDLIERLLTFSTVDGVGEPQRIMASAIEPTNLQVVCLALWRTLANEVTTVTKRIVAEHLEQPGDIEATLTSFCVRAVMDVAASQGMSELAVWEWLESTFITDIGTRGAAYEGVSTTGGMPNAVALAFEEHRILRSEKRAGSVWFELLHDVLVEAIRYGRHLSESLAVDGGPIVEGLDVGADAYLRMAKTALRDGLLPLAEEYAWGAVRASELDPRSRAEANAFLGELVLDQVRSATGEQADELYATAEDNFRQAAMLFDTEQNARAVGQQQASLGRMFMERGRYADAVGELRSALDRLRGDLDIRIDFARALARSGQNKAAIGEYTAAIVLAPEEARAIRTKALLGRGLLSAEIGDPVAALRDLDDAVRLRPHLADDPEVVMARSTASARAEVQRAKDPPTPTGYARP